MVMTYKYSWHITSHDRHVYTLYSSVLIIFFGIINLFMEEKIRTNFKPNEKCKKEC